MPNILAPPTILSNCPTRTPFTLSPIETMPTMPPTPIIIPSIVNNDRILLANITFNPDLALSDNTVYR